MAGNAQVQRVIDAVAEYGARASQMGIQNMMSGAPPEKVQGDMLVASVTMAGYRVLQDIADLDGPHHMAVAAAVQVRAARGWESCATLALDAIEVETQRMVEKGRPVEERKHIRVLEGNRQATGMIMQVLLAAIASCLREPKLRLDSLMTAGVETALRIADENDPDWR